MLSADGEAGDILLQIFAQNTMPLCHLGLFSHNLWDTCDNSNAYIPKQPGFRLFTKAERSKHTRQNILRINTPGNTAQSIQRST